MATYSVSSKESPCPQDSIKESTHTKDNRILTCIANQNIMIEQRRSKNLKDLVRSGSHIHIHKYQVLWFLQNGSIHTACTTPTAWCTLTWTNRQSTTNSSYVIPQCISFMFNNVIFLKKSNKCGQQYIDQTKQYLH